MISNIITKTNNPKIHFIHHLEKLNASANVGDWIASPYYYFIDFFSQYTCILHSDWSVLWHEIEKSDIVIFGGGGLLDNSDQLNQVFNKITEKCDNVIIWGAGTHKYNADNIFNKKTSTVPINFEKTLLSGVRDYNHPYQASFLPCASCLHPAFDKKQSDVEIKREVGVIRSALESSFAVSGFSSSITNAEPIGSIAEYILSSKVILVSSYHGAYWSMLLGKKAILPKTRLGVDKYRYFRHQVGFYDDAKFDEGKILELAHNLPDPSGFLIEARQLNLDFFQKVRNFIEQRVVPVSKCETIQIMAKRIAQMEFTIIEMSNDFKRLNKRLIDIERATSEPGN
ncbi:polysaccharide pyruvyl transferase family protein [Sphingobium sp. LF-16]|uniref:polysaccharide pyruvyl transferase family protein n=1 Tax=Sphingobium sp. LF-16 TaxID=2185111 RepID=UPI0013DE3D46|nr:polysaccharide pyruvyl transferase family protein [Sphingobium sp. LF-16]